MPGIVLSTGHCHLIKERERTVADVHAVDRETRIIEDGGGRWNSQAHGKQERHTSN